MKNKYLYALGAIIIVILLAVFLSSRSSAALVGETLLVSNFSSENETGQTVLLQVPFLRTLEESAVISIAVDTDSDGAFSEDETLVSDFPVRPRTDWRGGYYVRPIVAITDEMQAQVTVNGKEYQTDIETKTIPFGDLLDLETVTDPENATKGWGASVVGAQGEFVQITQNDVPDLNQQKGECAPTAAANSLISLVAKNGGEDLIPGDPEDFIENLKRHMNWTAENGVPPDDFVAGKNRWAAAAGVPIRTTKVGDSDGISTIDDIREALQNGDAVELRIKFSNPEGTASIGGHMVTVVGIHQGEGQTYLEINDPGTPDSGTETIKIESNQVTDYAWDKGLTILSWGFVQTWEGHPTGELFDTMTDEEIEGIRQAVGDEPMITVIEYRGEHIPVSQLRVGPKHPPHATGEGCPEDHWHADGPVTSIEGNTFTDPNPGGCGFGTLKQRPSTNIPALDHSGAGIEVRGLESLKTQ
jgi:hypothetical protein